MRRTFIPTIPALLAVAAFSVPSQSMELEQGEHGWCGTDGYHSQLVVAQANQRWFEKRAKARRLEASQRGTSSAIASAPIVRKEGPVAVFDDDGSLVALRNLFDFSNRSLGFARKKKNLRAKSISASIKPDFGERIGDGDWGGCETTIAPVDDDSKRIDLPFKVKFYGKKYNTLFVNSDGNLTFGTADCASSERGLTRVLNGPPRILPFFGDLDPSVVSGERGVFVKQAKKSVQITWNQVPEFANPPNLNNANTFQITVFKNGKVNVAFGDTDAPGSIVGASPGGGVSTNLVDFSEELPIPPTSLAILERYSEANLVNQFGVVEEFYKHFRDIYSQVIIWTDFPAEIAGFANAQVIKNDVEGLGLAIFDATEFVGSDGVLEGLVQMGEMWRYPRNPEDDFLGTNNTLDILGQEAGHRWLARARVRLDGSPSEEILGRDLAHWSFFMDSDASDMEGNDIMDLGTGQFETVEATSRFSALDQYFMGLIPPEAVGPQFFVRKPNSSLQPASAPAVGVRFSGERVDFTVDDIIAQEGPRVPAAEDSPKTFRMAFILVSAAGEPASDIAISRIRTYAEEWAEYFNQATDGNGKVSIALKERRK